MSVQEQISPLLFKLKIYFKAHFGFLKLNIRGGYRIFTITTEPTNADYAHRSKTTLSRHLNSQMTIPFLWRAPWSTHENEGKKNYTHENDSQDLVARVY